jgi:hypothetical protein
VFNAISIHRFSNTASLDAWEKSDEYLKQIEEANKYSTIYYDRATGLETWFTLPDLKTIVAPPKWKTAIATFIGAYCISSLVTLFLTLDPYIRQSPYLVNTIMTTPTDGRIVFNRGDYTIGCSEYWSIFWHYEIYCISKVSCVSWRGRSVHFFNKFFGTGNL